MANELTLATSFGAVKGPISDQLSGNWTSGLTGSNYIKTTQNISTVAQAINLGSLGSVGQYLVKNTDASNPVDLLSSTAGTTFCHLLPGASNLGYFPPTITAPAARASGAVVQIAYLITEI
jgi:hypothetical protein